VRIIVVLPATLWFLLIMVLLSLPGSAFPSFVIWAPDKIAHILMFGMQFLLLWLAMELPRRIEIFRLPPLVFSASATILFGILSEIYQEVCTTRVADVYDMIANTIGVLLAMLLIRLLKPTRILAFLARHLHISGRDAPTKK
jgi:VanZ family protein